MTILTDEVISGAEIYRLVGGSIVRILEDGEYITIKTFKNDEEAKERFERLKNAIKEQGDKIVVIL